MKKVKHLLVTVGAVLLLIELSSCDFITHNNHYNKKDREGVASHFETKKDSQLLKEAETFLKTNFPEDTFTNSKFESNTETEKIITFDSEKLKQKNIPLIEECAGCTGSVYFSDEKILRPGASGIGCIIEPEFALICCQDEAFAEKLPLSDSISAANFMCRQPDFERVNGRRRLAVSKYRLLIHEKVLLPFVSFPQFGSASFASASVCPLCVKDRDALKEYLESQSISCGTLPYAFENTGCPVFEKLKNELLLLPAEMEISEAEQEEIVSRIKYFYRDKNHNLQ